MTENSQRFTNNILPNDFCLDNYNEVYIYFYKENQHLLSSSTPTNPNYINIDIGRGAKTGLTNDFQTPVDNLLGEVYDKQNYHMFIKGVIREMTGNNKPYYEVYLIK